MGLGKWSEQMTKRPTTDQTFKATPATPEQVREFYRSRHLDVRITKEGHVRFRSPTSPDWQDGRWVSEYVVTEDGSVPTH
jgi:hypothetical protein